MKNTFRIETDSFGEIKVQADKLWGAQTQRCIEHFSIGKELMPTEMVHAYAIVKKAAAKTNVHFQILSEEVYQYIEVVCEEIIAGKHADMFPLHVWMTGSGTQFNMNINEVISNRASQLAGNAIGSKLPVHPNDHVNLSQSSNDTFPTAMCISSAILLHQKLMPALKSLAAAIQLKADSWSGVIKIGRTHLQDATPLTLGQEWSGYAAMLNENVIRLEQALSGLYPLALGGTAVGTGLNAPKGFDQIAVAEIAQITQLPFCVAKNKFAVQGSHDAMVHLSATLKTLAVSLYKIANDIRLMACGPRAGLAELNLPPNEPGSSIMPGKVNPTQAEALTMLTVQVMANDVAIGFGGAGGYLEMNVYKPLIIHNIIQSITLLTDGMHHFNHFLIVGTTPNYANIQRYVERSLMLVTALTPVIGYDKASEVAHYATAHQLTLKEAVLHFAYVSAEEFDRIIDPHKMI